MPLFSQTRRPAVGSTLDLLHRIAAGRTSTITLAAEQERKGQLSARRFTPGMPAQRHPLLETLRRRLEFQPRVENVRRAVQPTGVQVRRMATILQRIDSARQRGIPLANVFRKR